MGPVLAFCETWVKRVFAAFSIGAGCPDGAAPARARCRGGGGSASVGSEVDHYRIAVAPDGVGADLGDLEHGRSRAGLRLVVTGLLGRLKRCLGLDFDLPSADERRLRAVGGHVAAASTDERDHRVRRAGAGEALFAFLEPAPQAVGAEPFLGFDADGMVILTHEDLLQIAAEVLRRRSPGACAMHREWAADQRVTTKPA